MKNINFEEIPSSVNCHAPDIHCNQCYIYTDTEGTKFLVAMTGEHRRDQQTILDGWHEQTVSRKLYAKGYRYKMAVIGQPQFAPIHVKTTSDISAILYDEYSDRKFLIGKINELGECSLLKNAS